MSKDSQKYTWDYAAGKLPSIDPHSKIKHKIIRDYIEEYISVIFSNPQIPEVRLSIVDGFCGGGLYQEEHGGEYYGSPLVILDAIDTAEVRANINRVQPRFVRSRNYFVDKDHTSTECLKVVLRSKGYGDRIGRDINVLTGRFSERLPSILQNIKSFGGGERALFLLDQYAYKDVPLDLVKTIFQTLKGAEVLLTFNVSFLMAYLSDRPENRKALENIGLDAHVPWEDLETLKRGKEWKGFIQSRLAAGIKERSGAKFMTVFFIKPLGSSSMPYWFIHLANEYRANNVMKSLHWKHSNHFSHGLNPSLFIGYDAAKDVDVTGQFELIPDDGFHFDEATGEIITEQLSDALPRMIYEVEHQPFIELMSNITNFTMADEKRIKDSLNAAISSGDIEVYDKTENKRRKKGSSIKKGDIIIAPPQRPLFFFS